MSRAKRPSPECRARNEKEGVFQPKYFDGLTAAEMLQDLVCSCRGVEPYLNNCTCKLNNLHCTDECLCASIDRDCFNDPDQTVGNESDDDYDEE